MKRFRCMKPHVCTHNGVLPALQHPSVWAGVAGVLSTLGAEIPKPYNIAFFVLSGICSVIAIIIRTPGEIALTPSTDKEHT